MTIATTATGPMTADEFWEFVHRPENAGRTWELERGRAIEMPPPSKPHGFVCANVSGVLRDYSRQYRRGYVVSNDSGLIVARGPDTVRGPDVCFYDDGQDYQTMDPKFSTTVPRLVAEVRSPTDREQRIRRRVAEYLRLGVPLVWLVEPDDTYVTVYEPGKIHDVLDETDELIGGTVLPDFRCRVADLFALPGRP